MANNIITQFAIAEGGTTFTLNSPAYNITWGQYVIDDTLGFTAPVVNVTSLNSAFTGGSATIDFNIMDLGSSVIGRFPSTLDFVGHELDNNGGFTEADGSSTTIAITADKLGGTGAWFIYGTDSLDISAKVGAGQQFDFLGNNSTLQVSDPADFDGQIAVPNPGGAPDYQAIFAGITASSYDFKNSTVTLYGGSNGNKVLDKIAFTDLSSGPPVAAYQSGANVILSDFATGTPLQVHT